MKLLLQIFILLLIPALAFPAEPLKKDSLPPKIRVVKFNNSFRTDTFNVDTSIEKIHMLNPYMYDDLSYTYLTRSGYPFLSNNIKTRIELDDYFFPLNYFSTFIQDSRSTYFYDTKRAFSSLTYKFSGEASSKEEFVEVIHTRGLSDHTNMGLHYNLFSNTSRVDNQQTNDHCLNFYVRNSGKVYLNYFQLYYNSFSFSENGGIVADSAVDYTNADRLNGFNTNLTNASSKIVRFGLNTTHELKFGQSQSDNDTIDLPKKDYGSVVYMFSLETNKKTYFENDSNIEFYSRYYSKSHLLNDSLILDKMTNKILLNSPLLVKYLPNLRVSATNVIYNSFHGRVIDTIVYSGAKNKSWQSYSQTWITSDFNQTLNKFLLNITWDSYVLGYGLGDQLFKISTTFFADSAMAMSITGVAKSELRKPSFLTSSIFSNHYIWNKGDSLNRSKKQELTGILSIDRLNTNIIASYILYSDMVYFTNLGIAQTHENLNIFDFTVRNKLKIGKFSTENIVTYQKFDKTYFHLPELIFYNSTEFQHTFRFSTGGKLYAKLGVDFKYQTKYKPDTYLPSLGVFGLTEESDNTVFLAGNHLVSDVHLTFKVKNVSFYIKYSHFNAKYAGISTFNAAHYPMLPAILSYGINWLFYD